MNVVFLGTPIFAIPALNALVGSRHKVLAVISQPDRAKDRKGRLLPTPVAAAAQKAGLTLFQFGSVKKEGVETLKKLNADIFITAAYGQILSQEILDIPRFGVVNIHASLLPLYRGSSPVHHAILNGDKKTGVTIMQTRLSLDSGEIILQDGTEIHPDENTQQLMDRLSEIGAKLLIEALDQIEKGTAEYLPQRDDDAVFCGKITPLMSKIDWNKPAAEINNLIRALSGTTTLDGRMVKINKAVVVSKTSVCHLSTGSSDVNKDKDINMDTNRDEENIAPGEILHSRILLVKCGDGILEILELTPAGGKTMTGQDFLLGFRDFKTREKMRFE